jgi:hypothetical protein
MERKLWVLRQRGGQIELDLPVVAAVVDGELRSKAEGARGTAPANGRLAMAYLVLRDECLLRLFPKPLRDGVHLDLGKMVSAGIGSRQRSAAADAGDLGEHRVQGLVL